MHMMKLNLLGKKVAFLNDIPGQKLILRYKVQISAPSIITTLQVVVKCFTFSESRFLHL